MALRTLAPILILALLTVCNADSPAPSPSYSALEEDFYNKIYRYPDGVINKTLDYLKSTGVLYEYFSLGNATLLFPTDSAYKLLTSDVLSLLNGTDGTTILTNLLRYHIIVGYYDSAGLQELSYGKLINTYLGAPMYAVNVGDSIFLTNNKTNAKNNVTVDGPDSYDDFLSHSAHTIPEIIFPADLSVLVPVSAAPTPAPAPTPTSTASNSSISTPSPSKSGSGTLSSSFFTLSLAVFALFGLGI